MKKTFAFFVLIACIFCFSCNTRGKNSQSIITSGIELSVEPGEHWLVKVKILMFHRNRIPQMAAWIEDNQGYYISTITVTNKGSKNKWKMAPKNGRPEALPVWSHKIVNTDMAQIDSVSAATSKKGVEIKIYDDTLIKGKEYNVYLEVNHSFDYNETWPEVEDDVNGQPSLIYWAKFTAGESGITKLIPIGHGSVDGSNGNIVQELGGMTTALTIIDGAYIILK